MAVLEDVATAYPLKEQDKKREALIIDDLPYILYDISPAIAKERDRLIDIALGKVRPNGPKEAGKHWGIFLKK